MTCERHRTAVAAMKVTRRRQKYDSFISVVDIVMGAGALAIGGWWGVVIVALVTVALDMLMPGERRRRR